MGSRIASLKGALSATLGVVLPSFLIILVISGCYKKFQNSNIVRGAMEGLQPAVVALIATALLSVAGSVFDIKNWLTRDNLLSVVIVLIAGFLCYKKKHPIMVIGVSAFVGMIFGLVS